MVGFEGGTEALQRGRSVEFVDFPLHLLRDEFPLEICFRIVSAGSTGLDDSHTNSQCSCLPVSV